MQNEQSNFIHFSPMRCRSFRIAILLWEKSNHLYIKTIFKANASQVIRYDGEETGNQVLGLRFVMEQQHFQMQELKLRCVAIFRRTIADFQEHIVIRTMNPEVIEAQSNVGIHSTADNGIKTNKKYIKQIILLLFYV